MRTDTVIGLQEVADWHNRTIVRLHLLQGGKDFRPSLKDRVVRALFLVSALPRVSILLEKKHFA